MIRALKRLQTLRISDVMRPIATTISANESMAGAALALLNGENSAVPVVDEQGCCVGMLSALDFVRRETRLQNRGVGRPSQTAEIESDRKHVVRTQMSTVVHSILADASLQEAAEAMCEAHVHRLPVLDVKGHVVGIVTSLDLVAATLQALKRTMLVGAT